MKWKLSIELDVNKVWVEDGFDLNEAWKESITRYFEQEMLPYASEGEVKCKLAVTSAPNPELISKTQGY
jgi:hypothetical protein